VPMPLDTWQMRRDRLLAVTLLFFVPSVGFSTRHAR